MPTDDNRRRELAGFLRSRRERLRPADVDLPAGGRRRTPGLRREEVALLSGVSSTWYTFLEQGRDIRVSRQVLDGLSRALRLTTPERAHLFRLAQGQPPAGAATRVEDLDPLTRRVLDLLPAPAYVTGRRWDLLGWNPAAAALFDGWSDPTGPPNLVWWMFTEPAAQALFTEWRLEARALLRRFRGASARYADDLAFGAMVADLTAASPAFRHWWSTHDVDSRGNGTKQFHHPRAGDLTLQHAVYHLAEHPDQKLVVYTAEAASTSAHRLAALNEHLSLKPQ